MLRTTFSKLFCSRLVLIMALAVAITGCNKGPVNPGGGGGGGGQSPAFIHMTVNDAPVNLNVGGDIEAIVGSQGNENWAYSSGLWNVDENVGWEIIFGNIDNFGTPSAAQFSSLFEVGPRDYVSNPQMEFGVTLWHMDEQGDYWSTACGAQTNASFNVTQIQSISGGPFPAMRVEGTFSCTLHNCLTMATKTITNGTFRLYYENI